MNTRRKFLAATVAGGILLSAFPLNAVYAAEEPAVEQTTAVITLEGTTAKAEGSNVTIEGNKITISASGKYEISGTMDDGQIIVNVPDIVADPETVKLFFNGVIMTGVSEAPILVENAENTSINLMDGTENILCDGGAYTATNAVIYAKDDITLKAGGELGTGQLLIRSEYQHGLHCNNDVKITGGDIIVRTDSGDGTKTGIGDGIRGKKSVQIKGGKLDIHSGGDGIKSTKGGVLISGGDTEIKADKDAVQGETSVQISGGELKANGDRGLTNAASGAAGGGPVTITGGVVLATATDNQAIVADNTQPVLLFNTAEEQKKDQRIALLNTEGTAIFSKNPNKKFDYVLVSSPDMQIGDTYSLTIGGYPVENNPITLAGAITTVENVVSTAPAQVSTLVDLNNDGHETVGDAVLLARIVGSDSTLATTPEMLAAADIDGDGMFTANDLAQFLKKLVQAV